MLLLQRVFVFLRASGLLVTGISVNTRRVVNGLDQKIVFQLRNLSKSKETIFKFHIFLQFDLINKPNRINKTLCLKN